MGQKGNASSGKPEASVQQGSGEPLKQVYHGSRRRRNRQEVFRYQGVAGGDDLSRLVNERIEAARAGGAA